MTKFKIVNILTITRMSQLQLALNSAREQGETHSVFDKNREGVAVVRERAIRSLMDRMPADVFDRTYFRFVDDDDIALNPFGKSWDKATAAKVKLVITSYMSNQLPVRVHGYIHYLALDSVVSGNWFVQGGLLRQHLSTTGRLYPRNVTKDLGYVLISELLSLTTDVSALPDVYSYIHRKNLFSVSMSSQPSDPEILRKIYKLSKSHDVVDGFVRYARSKGINTHALNIMNRYRNRTGHYPLFGSDLFSHQMAMRYAFDSRPVLQDLCDKWLTREYARTNDVPVMPATMVNSEDFNVDHLGEQGTICKISRASGWNVLGTHDPKEKEVRFHQMKGWLQDSFARKSGEFGYFGASSVIIEETLPDPVNLDVYCFNGVARFAQWRIPSLGTLMYERASSGAMQIGVPMNAYFLWPPLAPGRISAAASSQLDVMVNTAERLVRGMDFVRVDFLVAPDGKWVFNEMSPYANGLGNIPVTADGESVNYETGRHWTSYTNHRPEEVLVPNEIDKAFEM